MMARAAEASDWTDAFAQAWRRVARHAALLALGALGAAMTLALLSYAPTDPSLNVAAGGDVRNWLGAPGAALADLLLQLVGWAAAPIAVGLCALSASLMLKGPSPQGHLRLRLWAGGFGVLALAATAAALPMPERWPMATGLGGLVGDAVLWLLRAPIAAVGLPAPTLIAGAIWGMLCVALLAVAFNLRPRDITVALDAAGGLWAGLRVRYDALRGTGGPTVVRRPAPAADRYNLRPLMQAADAEASEPAVRFAPAAREEDFPVAVAPPKPRKESARAAREAQPGLPLADASAFELPRLDLLTKPKARISHHDEAALKQNARLLVSVLNDFGVKGEIIQIRPGPVVTLYELEPAPGVKTARVIGLADDIARSMSAVACRVAVVPGRNAIGIELPNAKRETVYFRDLLASHEFEASRTDLPLALGETIGGEAYVADLSKMPHLLIAGTTGSGKSVGINAMILSLLYRLPPETCRFIMIDPKMLELSVYQGIPHLLAPVVTDPKKAVAALKWTVREMESRYQLMSKLGVRNIAGFNERVREAARTGERIQRTVQTGWDHETSKPIYETEILTPEPMAFIVVVIDEMADLMLVAGKEIEGAVQRLAQMARAAGIHLMMATQRPSVDVITGTIKANFPTRISYQVTSKIDSRTILGEQGAEQLLGQGDLLFMAGGGRIRRLHGPFVSDQEVERVVDFLKSQGAPAYLDEITVDPDGDDDEMGDLGLEDEGDDLYARAIQIVKRDKKVSTSYLQRRLQVGYNRAASLVERMENDGLISPPNHAGKREILIGE